MTSFIGVLYVVLMPDGSDLHSPKITCWDTRSTEKLKVLPSGTRNYVWYGVVWHGMVYDMVYGIWYSIWYMVWYGKVLYSMVWYGFSRAWQGVQGGTQGNMV